MNYTLFETNYTPLDMNYAYLAADYACFYVDNTYFKIKNTVIEADYMSNFAVEAIMNSKATISYVVLTFFYNSKLRSAELEVYI